MYDPQLAYDCALLSKKAYGPEAISCGETQFIIGDIASGRFAGCQYLAFRGTESPLDWLTDANVDRVGYRGFQVHEGFLRAYRSAYASIVSKLDVNRSLIITGHSLGGALATLAAYDLLMSGFLVNAVYTFGSPRVGCKRFAAAFNLEFRNRSYRIIHSADIVCRLPTPWRYRHVDASVFYDHDKPGVMDVLPWYYGLIETAQHLIHFRAGHNIKDHFIDGYISALTFKEDL